MSAMVNEVSVENGKPSFGDFREVMNRWRELSEAEREAFANTLNTEEEVEQHPEARIYNVVGFDFTVEWIVEDGGIVLPLRRRTVGELAWHVATQIIKEVKLTGDWYGDSLMVLLPPDAPLPQCDGVATTWFEGSEAYHVGLSLLTKAGEHMTQKVRRKGFDGQFREEPLYARSVGGYEILTAKTYHRKVMEKLMRQGLGDWSGSGNAFDEWLDKGEPIVADTIDLPGASFCVPGGAWSINLSRAIRETDTKGDPR